MSLLKKVLILSSLSFLLSSVVSAEMIDFTIGNADYAVEKNDEITHATLEAAPFIEGGRTMVPVRVISDTFGADIGWDNVKREVTIKSADKEIVLTIDSSVAIVDGAEKTLDAAPVIVNGRTFVPLRFVSEELSYNVNYVRTTKNVIIDNTETVIKCGDEKISLAEFKALYNILYSSSYEDAMQNEITEETLKQYILQATLETSNQIARVYNTFPDVKLTEDDYNEIKAGLIAGKELYESSLAGLDALVSERYYYSLGINILKEIMDSGKADEVYASEYISAKHILVEDEKLADTIYKKLVEGADFDELVKEHNTDPGMEQNPDGYVFTKGDMVKEFEEASYALAVGEISKPVKTTYGYHIIVRVELPEITESQKLKVVEDMANNQLKDAVQPELVMDLESLTELMK